jgi:hypothetical protein
MEEKKYQIFISSTYSDLIKAREKIIETILRLYHFPVGMEMFSADDDEQWEIIKDTIDMSDYYIVIIGHRYGSETSEGISYTEKEYDYAIEQNVPILAFIRRRDVATKPNERDDEVSKNDKLNNFIEKATKNKMCEVWENEDDLSTKVAIALPKIFRKNPRIGWVRADKAVSPEVSEELAKLSKENRTARDEIEKLESQLKGKKPALEVRIDGQDNLELSFADNKEMEITLGKQRIPISLSAEREPLSQKDVPTHLRSYVSESDIAKYNKELPITDRIAEFNRRLELFWRIKDTSHDLLVSISNTGNMKANEVFVDIEFPPEVMILERDDIESYKFPKTPFPENPIQKAERELKKVRTGPFAGITFDLDEYSTLRPTNVTPIAETIANLTSDREHRIIVSDNKISIKLKSLLHTRTIELDDFAVVPLKSGNFEVKIKIICEEYDKEIIKIIPVIISEGPANK